MRPLLAETAALAPPNSKVWPPDLFIESVKALAQIPRNAQAATDVITPWMWLNVRRNSPTLAGRWLGSMGSQEAARELLADTDLKQQRQALVQMKPHRAAALLEVTSALSRHKSWQQQQCAHECMFAGCGPSL